MTRGKIYYPVSLDVEGRLSVVVGAGKVAVRKIKQLLESGAKVRVIGEKTVKEFQDISANKNITLFRRSFRKSDLKGAFLAIAATDDGDLNKRISDIARDNGILVNVADSPKNCDFILPSVMRRGNLTVSVSTDGHMPLLSRKVRESIESQVGTEYIVYSEIISSIRKEIYEDGNIKKKNKQEILERLCDGTLLEMLKEKASKSEVKNFIKSVCGKEIRFRK